MRILNARNGTNSSTAASEWGRTSNAYNRVCGPAIVVSDRGFSTAPLQMQKCHASELNRVVGKNLVAANAALRMGDSDEGLPAGDGRQRRPSCVTGEGNEAREDHGSRIRDAWP